MDAETWEMIGRGCEGAVAIGSVISSISVYLLKQTRAAETERIAKVVDAKSDGVKTEVLAALDEHEEKDQQREANQKAATQALAMQIANVEDARRRNHEQNTKSLLDLQKEMREVPGNMKILMGMFEKWTASHLDRDSHRT